QDGLDWDTSVFFDKNNVLYNGTLYIGGVTPNASAETSVGYKIISVVGNVITVDKVFGSQGVARNIDIGVSIAVSGEAPRVTAEVAFDL
ncbi:hypothetical protein NK896_24035, partial [Salmonella enterica subsp. enterica serovar Typhimurium]